MGTLIRYEGSVWEKHPPDVYTAGQLVLAQVGALHREAAHTIAAAVYTARELVAHANASGRLTPTRRAALSYRTQAYLYEMQAILEETGMQMLIDVVNDE